MGVEPQWGGFIRPVGSGNEQLRAALVNLIDRLNSIKPAQTTEVAAVATDVADLTTTVENLELTGGTLTPQQEFELALDHAIDTIQGSRAEWQVYIEDQFRKLSDAILQVSKWQQDDTALITTEQVVRATENEAFASQVTAITADIASTNAAIVTEQTARASGDSALASSISTLSTTVGGNTASINEVSESVDGISARKTISVSANGNVTGYLDIGGSNNVSGFNVVVGKFSFALTDNGSATPFFTAGNVNGTPTSVFTGTLIGDGTIIGRHILAGEITAGKIAAGAVTADKISVTNLKAVSSSFGDMTCSGQQRSANGKMVIDWSANTWTVTA